MVRGIDLEGLCGSFGVGCHRNVRWFFALLLDMILKLIGVVRCEILIKERPAHENYKVLVRQNNKDVDVPDLVLIMAI